MKMPDFCIQTLICENCGSKSNFSILKNCIRSKFNSSLFKNFCLHYMKIDICCGGDTSFVHMTKY